MEYKGIDLTRIYITIKINVCNFNLKNFDEDLSINDENFLLSLENVEMDMDITEPDSLLELTVDRIKFYDH